MASNRSSLSLSDSTGDAPTPAETINNSTASSVSGEPINMAFRANESNTFTVHTSLVFDPIMKAFRQNCSFDIDRDRGAISAGYPRTADPTIGPNDIDLRGKIVLPGLVDAHTHIFLHSDAERPHSEQMLSQSLVERTVRATNHARAALLAGYTTYRDLGTEALGSADARLRDCINRGTIPGPRMFVATEAIASSGGYEVRAENRFLAYSSAAGGNGFDGRGLGLGVPRAADIADGVDGVRAAVRRRVGEGADIIKFYADYRRKTMRFLPDVCGPGGSVLFPPDVRGRNPVKLLYSQEEMDAIVAEARVADVPVAAHCGETSTAMMAVKAGVTSVEHVFEDSAWATDDFIDAIANSSTVWVPTLATAEAYYDGTEIFKWCKATVKKAFDKGVKLAAGGDTGVINHGLNVREMEIMMEAGIPVEDVLVAGTYHGWMACGSDACGFYFGQFGKNTRADIIALDTDPRDDPHALRKVSFVMKDGRVWKQDGKPVNMVPETQWPN